MGKLRQGQAEQRPEPGAEAGTLLPVQRGWGQPAHPGVPQLTSSPMGCSAHTGSASPRLPAGLRSVHHLSKLAL